MFSISLGTYNRLKTKNNAYAKFLAEAKCFMDNADVTNEHKCFNRREITVSAVFHIQFCCS